MELAKRGPPPFQVFLEQHRTVVYRFLRASVGANDADDCFQETFLAALRAYPRLRHGENLRSWVLTIATRKAIDAGRSGVRRPLAVADPASVADPSEAEAATGRDPADPLWVAVRTLPIRQRAAVVHRFVLDRSYRDIAEVMGSSEETARANVSQGLKKLRKELRDATE